MLKNKLIKLTLIVSLSFGIIGYLLFLISLTGIFRLKVIDTKYCYIFKDNKIERVFLSYDKKFAYKILDFYQGLYKDTLFEMSVDKRIAIPYNIKAEVLEYTEDSILALIRIEWEVEHTPFLYTEKGFVPTITLHDTLPCKISYDGNEGIDLK